MATIVVMPQLGNSVESCIIVEWMIAEGDTDDVLTAENLAAARHHIEAWDDTAPFCEVEAAR